MSAAIAMPSGSSPVGDTSTRNATAAPGGKQAPKRRRLSLGQPLLGKYREILIAVTLFLLFDLGVLMLNFYTSFQIGKDAAGINMAGRQLMLTQRMTKALLDVERGHNLANPEAETESASAGTDDTSAKRHRSALLGWWLQASSLEELGTAAQLFDVSLAAFEHGGTVPDTANRPVALRAVTEPDGQRTLKEARALWNQYYALMKPVIADQATPAQITEAVNFGRDKNIALLDQMSQLSSVLERTAAKRADTLRMVQTVGIVLALLNFVFILVKFIRRLNTADVQAEAVARENGEILSSVREGLFLLNGDMTLGRQISASAPALLGAPLKAGDDFVGVLSPMVSEKTCADARDYIALLFSPHIKEALVQDINPLSEVEFKATDRLGNAVRRYLSFQFNRVEQSGTVSHLLVTMQDVTPRVELQRQLAEEKLRSQREVGALLKTLQADPAELRQFVERAGAALEEVNRQLAGAADIRNPQELRDLLALVARRIHALKGDAAALGLDMTAGLAHGFENELAATRERGDADALGSGLLSLLAPLEELIDNVQMLRTVLGAQRPATPAADAAAATPAGSLAATAAAATRLAQDIARETGKELRPEVRLPADAALDARRAALLHEIVLQLARNAVVHGVETPEARAAAGKPVAGRLTVALEREETGGWLLSVRDDGAGVDAGRIRERLVAQGVYSAERAAALSEREVVQHIFMPNFSTAESVTAHAGRGVGLDVVMDDIRQLGGRLQLKSAKGEYTEFRVRFAG